MLVAAQHLAHQLGGALEDLLALVGVDLDRAPHRPYRHAGCLPSLAAASPAAVSSRLSTEVE